MLRTTAIASVACALWLVEASINKSCEASTSVGKNECDGNKRGKSGDAMLQIKKTQVQEGKGQESKVPDFVITENSFSCEEGNEPIISKKACQAAGDALGLGLKVKDWSNPKDPKGCFIFGQAGSKYGGSALRWNTNENALRSGKRQKRSAICTTSALPECETGWSFMYYSHCDELHDHPTMVEGIATSFPCSSWWCGDGAWRIGKNGQSSCARSYCAECGFCKSSVPPRRCWTAHDELQPTSKLREDNRYRDFKYIGCGHLEFKLEDPSKGEICEGMPGWADLNDSEVWAKYHSDEWGKYEWDDFEPCGTPRPTSTLPECDSGFLPSGENYRYYYDSCDDLQFDENGHNFWCSNLLCSHPGTMDKNPHPFCLRPYCAQCGFCKDSV